ncbi:MAG: hypothetical protein RJA49_1193 [Actinomycetota bacterium]
MRPLAEALSRRGWSPVVPDLRAAASTPAAFCAAAASEAPRVDVVLGHSGAGFVLPALAALVGAGRTVFIDAVLPDETTHFVPSNVFLAFVDSLPIEDGLLPPWHRWWPADTIVGLLPDEGTRSAVTDEIPSVPRAFYDAGMELPERWWTTSSAYLQLSPAYDDEMEHARRLGWPTIERSGRHLDLVVVADEVAVDVLNLLDELRS